MRMHHRITVVALVVLCFSGIFYRIHRLRGAEGSLLPQRHYELILDMRMYGHSDDLAVRAYLPMDTERQSVRDEVVSSGAFRFTIEEQDGNRLAVWRRNQAVGPQSLVYSCTVRSARRRYRLAPGLPIPSLYPAEVERYLLPTDEVQSDAPEIAELLQRIVPESQLSDATAVLRAIFDYSHDAIAPASYKGSTDALTCLRLGEASCGGKSRLFIALARAARIPARMVGGLILKESTWQSTHVWAEAWVGGQWVPFCPLNGYFGELPERYLITYVGDLPQFRHTRDINFSHAFSAKRILAPPSEWMAHAGLPALGAPNLWLAFEKLRIPVNLLKIILMIPFGALVVVLFRNVVGVETFGTFMPALMAVAFRDTGLGWGILLFAAIIAVGSLVRFALGRYHLLHTPRLGVILTVTVMVILLVALLGALTGSLLPTRVSLFPLAILTLTVERFAILLEEEGPRRSLTVVLGTLLVVSAAYFVMGLESLQLTALAFPEILLLLVAAFIVLGRFLGMRLSEYVRFRELLIAGRPR